jgi:hypothetical protein
VRRVLADGRYRRAARRIAGGAAELAPVDAAIDTLVALAREGAANAVVRG